MADALLGFVLVGWVVAVVRTGLAASPPPGWPGWLAGGGGEQGAGDDHQQEQGGQQAAASAHGWHLLPSGVVGGVVEQDGLVAALLGHPAAQLQQLGSSVPEGALVVPANQVHSRAFMASSTCGPP